MRSRVADHRRFDFSVQLQALPGQPQQYGATDAAYFPTGKRSPRRPATPPYSTLDNWLDPHNGSMRSSTKTFRARRRDALHEVARRCALVSSDFRRPPISSAWFVKDQVAISPALGQDGGIIDNFFKGGETVRGFATYGYGAAMALPAITITRRQELLGDHGRGQFPMPVFRPISVSDGAVFVDAGVLWGLDLPPAPAAAIVDVNTIRSSVGASVLWASPIGLFRATSPRRSPRAQTTRWSGSASAPASSFDDR